MSYGFPSPPKAFFCNVGRYRGRFFLARFFLSLPRLKLQTMKRMILIAALLVAACCAKAQTNETNYIVDTLSYRQLRAEIVNMNTQLRDFRNNELVAVGLGAGAAALSVAGLAMSAKGNEYGMGLYMGAGVLGVASLVWYIEGYAGLKLNRLEITPDGMVIKIRERKKPSSRPY